MKQKPMKKLKQKVTSLRLRILLPVILMTLFVVILLTSLFSRAYIDTILQQEQEVNAVGFETISHAVTPLINTAVGNVRSMMTDERFVSYARLQFASSAELIKARIRCRDFLGAEVAQHESIYGVLFMRKDGSLFGSLPEGNIYQDRPEDNSLPEAVKAQALGAPFGQTVWIGPVSGRDIYGFDYARAPENIMIAAWKSVDVSYGECYALMVMDGAVLERQLEALQDGKSIWRLFTADRVEFYHSGPDACPDPERLIGESNSGAVFYDENGRPFCAFSKKMTSPAWTLVREVSMEDYEQVVRHVRRVVWLTAGAVLLVGLALYRLWLKRFMRQFDSLLSGIKRIGQGNLEPFAFVPTSIDEFRTMQGEIHRTSQALREQMDTIRRMERDRMELEAKRKEQEMIVRELSTARQIQEGMLPNIFPAFPDRPEFDLYASMDPAKEVGGDFYDFFLIDNDHLALVMADVSGKGIPGALFMMASKNILQSNAMQGGSPADILERMNKIICANNPMQMFVTVWLGILEISTGRLIASNAGHEYPMIRRTSGVFEIFKDKHGFVVGGMEGMKYTAYELQLHPGDMLFLYTDGVPEATNTKNELFGTDRMLSSLNGHPGDLPSTTLRHMQDAVDVFVDGAEQFDDLTMLCLEYKGPEK